jgi:hypothetical protein
MLFRTPPAALAAFFIGSIGLAGCSGTSNATITHTPALQTTGGRDTARSGTQVAILVAGTTNGIALPGGPTPAGIARQILAMRALRPSVNGGATGACNNGVKQSQVTNGDGSKTTTTDYFYDPPACVTLETEEIIKLNAAGTDGTGSIVSYSRAGAVRVSETLTFTETTTPASGMTPASETITLQIAAAATVGGTTTAQVGATCVGPPNSQAVNCSVAHNGTSGGIAFGDAFATTGTAASGTTSASATVNVAFYLGPSLGIVQSGSNWGVSGNSAFNSATGTYTFSSTGNSGSGSLTLKDALYTYTETATLSSSGLTVTIIQNPNSAFNTTTPISTATIDVGGNGSINYTDGTSETIAGGLMGY